MTINSGDSMQKIIQFNINSQGIIGISQIRKVFQKDPKSVPNRQKKGALIKKLKYRINT